MIFDRDDTAYIPDPGREQGRFRCSVCKDERGAEVFMERGEEWLPGVVQAVWRCPECGHTTPQENAREEWV